MLEKGYHKERNVRPLWLDPSLAPLFDLFRLHRVKPWDIDISYVLTALVKEMRKRGKIDFIASGVALLSSSILYRMKSEHILRLQEPPKVRMERSVEFVPPPLQLPYRHEYMTTTVDDLIKALEEVLKREGKSISSPIEMASPPPIIRGFDQFSVNIEKNMVKLYRKIVRLAGSKGCVPFMKVVDGKGKTEMIRAFLLILLLASKGKVRLRQEREFGEIYVVLI